MPRGSEKYSQRRWVRFTAWEAAAVEDAPNPPGGTTRFLATCATPCVSILEKWRFGLAADKTGVDKHEASHGSPSSMRLFLLPMISALLLAAAPVSGAADEFDAIIARQREILLAKPSSIPPATVEQWVRALDASGAWPDINYKDQQPADWSPRYHLDRVVTMCKALLQAQSPLRGNPQLATAIDRALDHWIALRPHCGNWWHNDIGTPGFMRDVIFLLGDHLQGTRCAGAMEVLRQYVVKGEGANLVWTATLALSDGCLRKDEALVADSAAKLRGEIKITTGEGIQPDWSYHQHGARLQEFHYGGAYLHDLSRVAWMLAGTRFAVGPDKVQILVDYILQGQQWMARWRSTVPSTLDRAVSRPGAFDISDLDGNAALLAELSPKDRPAMEEVRARLARRVPALNGFRSYPRSDFACYQRPNFSFFVKTISTRTQQTEGGMNGENVKGWALNSGDTYLLRQGDEYADLMPVWDWTALPGVTAVTGLTQVDRQAFAGAVGDGEIGCAAMDYGAQDPHGTGRLHVRKAYFCHGDAVVCLVGDLTVTQAGDRPAQTALNQCLLRGPVVAADRSGQARTLSPGETRLLGAHWVYHDGLVYVPTVPANMTVRTGPVTGTWRTINASGQTAPVEKSVFLPFLTHDSTPTSPGAAGYAILDCPNPAQAPILAQSPGYRLLRNDAGCQAVRWNDGTVMAAFYAAGEVRDGNNLLLGVDQPCLALDVVGRLYASDPIGQDTTVRFTTYSGAQQPTALTADGRPREVLH